MATPSKAVLATLARPFRWIGARSKAFVASRPHRSFRRTRRRDALKPLRIAGYIRFTQEVGKTFWRHKKALLGIAGLYVVIVFLIVGTGSQDTYAELAASLEGTGYELLEGNLGSVNQALILALSIVNGNLQNTLDPAQQIIIGLTVLFMWLAIIWYLRTSLAGHTAKIRDALYNSGGPVLAIAIITAVIVVQLIPVGLAALGYTAALSTGLIVAGGVEAMLFWIAAGLLALLSAFWLSSSIFALVIATLPGMYPFRALSIAGGMVLGRRVKILLRVAWAGLCILLAWTLMLVPTILLDGFLKDSLGVVEWLPLVPVVALLLTGVTIVWFATYIYMLYRKVVDSDAAR